jgi:hypothetical protein
MESGLQNKFLQLIDTAIKNKRVVQIKLKESWRTVEPYLAGIHQTTQTTSLYCYCRDVIPGEQPGCSRWQIFSLDDIQAIELTLYEFETHYEYRSTAVPFKTVYAKMSKLAA